MVDYEKAYKECVYEVIPRLVAENTNLELAIKKLISERDMAIKDLQLITYNHVGEIPRSMCETCRDLKENCMKFYIRDKEVGCIWNWRGVKR